MKNLIIHIIFLMTFGFSGAIGFAQHNTLTVNITGIDDVKGDIYIYLYTSKSGFPTDISKAANFKKAEVIKKSLSVSFKDLAPGIYAVSVYQDVNSNGEMDTNFLGIPKEPVAVSNNAKGSFGPPKFEDAKFKFDKDKIIEITLNN